MRALVIGALLICNFKSLCGIARDSVILRIRYSPLFWKNELRLSRQQQKEINEVELDFYQSIVEVGKERESARSRDFLQLIQHRSEKIWVIFSKSQRAKWRRIIASMPNRKFRNAIEEGKPQNLNERLAARDVVNTCKCRYAT